MPSHIVQIFIAEKGSFLISLLLFFDCWRFKTEITNMDHERGLVIDDVLGGIQAKLSLEGTVLEQRASELKTVREGFWEFETYLLADCWP